MAPFKLVLLVLVCLFVTAQQSFADLPVEKSTHQFQLVKLKHRPAIEILTAIERHLPEGTIASEQDQNLLISGEASTLEQLEVLIHALDQPLKAWRVFFAQGQANLQASQQSSARHYSTASTEVFELLVREGKPARLERGFWIPVQTGVGEYRKTGYEWLSSGIWLKVKPLGDEIILNLSTQQTTEDRKSITQNPRFSGRQFEGEVALNLGRWVTLGSEAQLATQITDASRRYVGGSSNEYYSICIELSTQPSCPR